MRIIGSLLVVISLVVGTVAAATAYYAPLSLPDEAFQTEVTEGEPLWVELAAPAGLVRTDEGEREPLFDAGTALTPDVLATLRDHEFQRADGSTADVPRVRVSEFSFARWKEKWYFVLGSLGLVAGAALLRLGARRRSTAVEAGAAAAQAGPAESIAGVKRTLENLVSGRASEAGQERLDAIVSAIDHLQHHELDAFIEARDRLIGRFGLAGFARIMDRFAAMERQVNRAWSAAADGVLEESEACVAQALALVDEVEAAMKR